MDIRACIYIGLITVVFSINSATATQAQHGHGKLDKTDYFYGDQEFEAAESYDLVLRDEEGRVEMKSQIRQKSVNGLGIALRSKSSREREELYLRLVNILPKDISFRVVSATNTNTGDTVVTIESEHTLKMSITTKSAELLQISETPKYYTASPIVLPDRTIKSLSIPDGWTKEIGYQDIIDTLNTGKNVVKVSAVFDISADKGADFYNYPFFPIVNSIQYDQRGAVYGYWYSIERGIAWWTQEIDLEQATNLNNSNLVLNLITHKNN